jgi:hypothetical protein
MQFEKPCIVDALGFERKGFHVVSYFSHYHWKQTSKEIYRLHEVLSRTTAHVSFCGYLIVSVLTKK